MDTNSSGSTRTVCLRSASERDSAGGIGRDENGSVGIASVALGIDRYPSEEIEGGIGAGSAPATERLGHNAASWLRSLLSAAILRMEETIRVTLTGSHEGAYIVTEEHPDGSLVVVPDKSEKTNDSETLDGGVVAAWPEP